MDPQLQEIAKQIADVVEKRLSKRFDARFDAVDARFDAVDARFDAVDARFDAVDARFDAVDARFDEFEKRIDIKFSEAEKRLEGVIVTRLGEAEKRLSSGAKAHMDEVRHLVKLAAEGYGATLERIEGELKTLNTKVDTKLQIASSTARARSASARTIRNQRPSH